MNSIDKGTAVEESAGGIGAASPAEKHDGSPSGERMEDAEKEKLLIIDDDEDLRTQLRWALVRDYEVFVAADRRSAAVVLKKIQPAVIILDLGLPPQPAGVEEGFAVLDDVLDHGRSTKVIVLTGRGEKEHALRAVEKGAYDYIYKPIELDALRIILGRAFQISQLEREIRTLQEPLAEDPLEGMLALASKLR